LGLWRVLIHIHTHTHTHKEEGGEVEGGLCIGCGRVVGEGDGKVGEGGEEEEEGVRRGVRIVKGKGKGETWSWKWNGWKVCILLLLLLLPLLLLL
jgi:hypothetical protein